MMACSEHTSGRKERNGKSEYCPRPGLIIIFLTRKRKVWKDNSKVEID